MKMFGWSAATAVVMLAAPAYAIEVDKTVDSPAQPDAVWATIGDFCGIESWHPAATKCVSSEVDGTLRRTLTLPDGAELVEDLVSRDDAAMTYTYRIVEGPLPVANYESTIAVAPQGEGSRISWSGTFDADGATDAEASDIIGGIYDAGLKGIADAAAN